MISSRFFYLLLFFFTPSLAGQHSLTPPRSEAGVVVKKGLNGITSAGFLFSEPGRFFLRGYFDMLSGSSPLDSSLQRSLDLRRCGYMCLLSGCFCLFAHPRYLPPDSYCGIPLYLKDQKQPIISPSLSRLVHI